MIGATLYYSPHARDDMRQRLVSEVELTRALGPNVVDPNGAMLAPRAVCGDQAAPGQPLVIGRCIERGMENRYTLIACTPLGRWLHVVVSPKKGHRLDVITFWDPHAPENAGLWRRDLLAPTVCGEHTLPKNRWFVELQLRRG